MKDSSGRQVDYSVIRVNQAFTIALLLLAFVLNSTILLALVALVMLISAAVPRLGLFRFVYDRLLRPSGLVKPDVIADNPEPHRLAQGLGGTFVGAGFILVVVGYPLIGWALAWLVIALASANLFLGFCAGCFIYYQLNRLGVPGFSYRPVRRGDR